MDDASDQQYETIDELPADEAQPGEDGDDSIHADDGLGYG